VVLVAAAAAVAGYATAGEVPRGTTVLGVDVGARSRAAAERTLHAAFDGRAGEPVDIRLDGRSLTVGPAAIDLSLDVPATVAAAARRGILDDRAVHPVIRLDAAKLEALLRENIDRGRVTFRKPAITYDGVTPRASYPRTGLDLDLPAAVNGVRAAWLTGKPAVMGLAERVPALSDRQVDALVDGLATAAVAAPVKVTAGARSFVLSEATIAAGLVFRSDSAGRLTPAIDAGRLRAAARTGFARVETAAQAATISVAGKQPKVLAATPGRTVDMARLSADLLAVLPSPAPRGITATLVEQAAENTDAEMAALGVKERVSTFTTYFTGGARSPRSQNIVTIAKAVDGAIVKPGETFSLNGHTGERDYAAGYRDAPVIVGGKLEPGVGGGASQFTTTLFKNTTPYGILIDTATTGRSVTVAMWSTKYYDSVRTERSPRRGITSPPTIYREPGPRCISSSGLPGFTQDAWRIIRKDGREIERKKFTWRYDPEPRFVCGAKP
jgi:vancomycin resistance protein YoaR